MNAIEFRNFSCYYEHKKESIQALSHIDFSVREGEFLVVVGESGSGKSTLLKACLGLAATQLLPNMAAQAVGCALSGLLWPIIFVGWYLFALNRLDETVNKQYFPELVGRGILWETDEA